MSRDPIIPPMDLSPEELAQRLMQAPKEEPAQGDASKPVEQQDDA